MTIRLIFIVVHIVFSVNLLWCQDYGREQFKQEKRLKELRSEIANIEKQITQASTQKEALDDQLALLEHKLALRKQALYELKKDILKTDKELEDINKRKIELQKDIIQVEAEISALNREISMLKTIVGRRAVHAYKHWIMSELHFILSADDFNQACTRKRYFQAIASRDVKNLQLLKSKLEELNQLRLQDLSLHSTAVSIEQELQSGLQYKKELSEEVTNEQNVLLKEKKKKSQVLSKIKHNQSLLLKDLAQKRKAADKIKALISDLIAKAKTVPEAIPQNIGKAFRNLKGNLEWPAEGKVISRFGKQINPQLNTWTENTGIDIQTSPGAEVRTVAEGKVTYITWLRGYGTTMIISHPDDYYTVYTHLDEVNVSPGNQVSKGEVIAKLGRDETNALGLLHFEIWEKKNKQDPEKWLKPRG